MRREAHFKKSVSYTEDGGRLYGAGLQEQVSNHLKVLMSSILVVSDKE